VTGKEEQTTMRHKTFFFIILLVFMPGFGIGSAHAKDAADWIKAGNRAYAQKKYDEAIKAYDKAAIDAPESAIIDFNKGAAFYRKGDWKKAEDAWQTAAQKAKGPLLTARALYNLGNCEYKMARRQKDSDIQKAVDFCTESIKNFQKALDQLASVKDEQKGESDFELEKDAAKNMEIVRLFMKSMMDEIMRQKNMAKKARAASDALTKLIERQKQLIDKNKYFSEEKENTPKKEKEIAGLENEQKRLADDTDKLAEGMQPGGGKNSGAQNLSASASDPLSKAKSLLKKAVSDQNAAAAKIRKKELKDAIIDQTGALSKMKEALDTLKKEAKQAATKSGEKERKNDNKGESKKGEKGEKKNARAEKGQNSKNNDAAKKLKNNHQNPPDTAEKIIEQERQRREEAEQRAYGGYSNVDKDW